MNRYSVTYSFVLQVLIQVLYIIILCNIKEMSLEEKKLNSKSIITCKLLSTDKLECRDLTTHGMNEPAFSLLATTHSRPISFHFISFFISFY